MITGPGVICGLSWLALYSAPRGFSPGTQKTKLGKYLKKKIGYHRTRLREKENLFRHRA